MSKRWIMLFTTMIFAALIVSGCGSDKKESKEEKSAEAEETAAEKETEEPEAEEPEEEDKEEPEENVEEDAEGESNEEESSNDFSEFISYMEEETEGTAKVLYENDEQQVHEADDFSVSLDGYTLVELKDFHTDFEIPFNDQTDGGVIIAKYTVTNDTDEDAYYMPALYMSYTGAQKDYNNNQYLVPEEEQLPTKLSPANDYAIKAGESITGYYTYPFGEDHLKEVLDASTATVAVPAPHSKKGDVNSNFGKEGKFTLSLNEDGAEKVEGNKDFYADAVTAEDMGDKKMLKEKDGIDESEKLGDITVTLDGYQFTSFTPNEVEAPRFESFENGIVLLTLKFDLDNKNSSVIGKNSISSKLTVNDGSQYMLHEGMLLNYRNDDIIKDGESGELLQIFILDQEQYEKIWKNKSFEVEIGPMRDDDAKDISKGKQATFTLPE
ncbi:hypothetical protein JOC34_003297 [Virgibacillus halotolerans]|uniref:DUF5068 domain-containing protein n=1 Tax=Virgibacillus halotolerans TaxID=1071053 RepID=UPI00195FBA07|nr:DUF5068 domain-containing protein [Virgibacillus halotolerans]MBM7600883.1 hypothetical protein [Virgibacillus halotolerans]